MARPWVVAALSMAALAIFTPTVAADDDDGPRGPVWAGVWCEPGEADLTNLLLVREDRYGVYLPSACEDDESLEGTLAVGVWLNGLEIPDPQCAIDAAEMLANGVTPPTAAADQVIACAEADD
jgi:hypothetical protein